MAIRDQRRRRVLRAGLMQILWALMLVYLILAGTAVLFGRSVGYAISFGVCGGLAALTTIAFLALYIVDRVSAFLSDHSSGIDMQIKHRSFH